MSAGWVAGSVRTRALVRRRLGTGAARRLAACGSLAEAVQMLAVTPYGRWIRPGQSLAAAQHGIAEGILWDLRVLAGWLPPGGVQLMRALAGWFEIANVDELLSGLAGRPADDLFQLGALATAWPRLRRAASHAELRTLLTASPWKDPGGASEQALRVGMRVGLAGRIAALDAPAPVWAASAVALLVAGERFAAGRPLDPVLRGAADGLLGPGAADARTVEEMAARLPARLAWVLSEVRDPSDLWRAEAGWWARVERDGFMLLRTSALDRPSVLGGIAILAADAHRGRAALEIAARGGGPLEAYDAVA
jgi:hypothetical protein